VDAADRRMYAIKRNRREAAVDTGRIREAL
jgi:hypothetical protein